MSGLSVTLLVAVALFAAASANPENPPCPDVCTADFSPVCGVLWGQYRTFSNECQLLVTRCKQHQPWKVVAKCACVADSPGSGRPGSYRPTAGK